MSAGVVPESTSQPHAGRMAVTELKGVGPRVAERLEKLGIRTVQDVLFHLPLRYEDRTRVVPIGSLRPGDAAVVEGEIQLAEIVFRRRRSLLVRLADGTGAITLRFFHFSKKQQASLRRGVRLRCFGEARRGPKMLEIVHPEYRFVSVADESVDESLTPIYPATEGVQQHTLRSLTDQALSLLAERPALLPEWLPESLRSEHEWPALDEALRFVHRPPPDVSMARMEEGGHPVQRRLAFEELLAHHLSLRRLREAARRDAAPALAGDGRLTDRFLADLPFALTGAQERVRDEVFDDLSGDHPMMRLVQGDVGSGKTVVAALAALRAVESGCQVAIMAPTEILAEQHFHNFHDWLAPLGIEVAWLSGRLTAQQRRSETERIRSGRAGVAVGTHALFQEETAFDRLGLVVIDEQHRFGVHQRLALREKGVKDGRHPHQLIMTATPIPRTLAMTAYADLDTSVIDELPPGRKPVRTVVIPEERRSEIVERVHDACREGRQVYWVCPLIEESESLQCQAAEDTARQLTEALPEFRVGLVHGRMKPAEKEAVMQAFKEGEMELLVATTVIEVGVNVPNASLMIIENAERLGLAQLHQLRGRVGRGAARSSCVLVYRPPLSEQGKRRLAVMRETTDGFEIAREDLRIRGPGEVLGTKQTGVMQMRIADLGRDADLLPTVHKGAGQLLHHHPERVQALIDRWLSSEADRYGTV